MLHAFQPYYAENYAGIIDTGLNQAHLVFNNVAKANLLGCHNGCINCNKATLIDALELMDC